MKYKRKPIIVEAVQWTGQNVKEVLEFCPKVIDMGCVPLTSGNIQSWPLSIPTLEGNMVASIGDWIIKGIKGEFYPCKPDIFEAIYELA